MGKKEVKVETPVVEIVEEVVETPVEIKKPHWREHLEINFENHLDKDPNDPRTRSDR